MFTLYMIQMCATYLIMMKGNNADVLNLKP